MGTWYEEFIGGRGRPPDPANWVAETGGGGWGDDQLQTYTEPPNSAGLTGHGGLRIRAEVDASDGVTISSARLTTRDRVSFRYGHIAARVKVPSGSGSWPAFWVLGDDIDTAGWPDCGEIDVMETVGGDPTAVHGTVHGRGYAGVGSGVGHRHDASVDLSADFHIYSVDWRPGSLAWQLDGLEYFRVTPMDVPGPWPFDHHCFLLLNLAIGGRWPGNELAPGTLPADMLVDWIRVTDSDVLVHGR